MDTISSSISAEVNPQEIHEDEDDAILDDSFTDAMKELSNSENVKAFKLPQQFIFNLTETKFTKEITEFQKQYNLLVDKIVQLDCNTTEKT